MAEHVPESTGPVGPSLVPTTLSTLVAPGPAVSPFVAAAGAAAVPAESIVAPSADSQDAVTAEDTVKPHEELLSFSIIETAELQQLKQQLADVTEVCRQHELEAAVKDAELARLRKLTNILQDDVDDLTDDRQLLDNLMTKITPVKIERIQDRLKEEAASSLTSGCTRQLLLEADELLDELAEKQKGIAVFQGRLDDLRKLYRWAVNLINERNEAAAAPGEIVHSWPICRLTMPGSCCEYAKQLNRKLHVRQQNPECELAALRKEFAAAQKKHAAALQKAETARVLVVSALCASARYQQAEEVHKMAAARKPIDQKPKATKAYGCCLRGFAATGADGGQGFLQSCKLLSDSHLQ